MPLSDLTDPTAINAAMDEFDRLGRDHFLQKYGFGPSRAYFLRRNGKDYDSKAIVGAAYGFQHPQEGPLRSSEFSGGESTVQALLEGMGFSVEVRISDGLPAISETDIELIRASRSRDRYADLTPDEQAAHKRVHEALRQLGEGAVVSLGGARDYVLKLTSGFHPNSGVRGGKPKDLWFGVYRKENESPFLGNPQVFMIASERGIEYGFAPLTHPDDFSNQEIKQRTRAIARSVLGQLPAPGSAQANDLAARLSVGRTWHFRRKQRLGPNQSEYRSLDDWLSFVRSDEGIRNAGGAITRYALPGQIDGTDLVDEVRETVHLFRALMERLIADAPPTSPPQRQAVPAVLPRLTEISLGFGEFLTDFLLQFADARKEPFQKIEPLWNSMSNVKQCLEQFPALQARPDLSVSISVGQGNWASVPWIALLNTRITGSTQEGIYVAFLIANELDRVFLTLQQGATNLVRTLGQREAQKHMLGVAAKVRPLISDLAGGGFALDNQIALGGEGWLARDYEIGTIAHADLSVGGIPSDDRMNSLLEAVLEAYDKAVDAPSSTAPQPELVEAEPALISSPYGIDDALSELFLEQSAVERLLSIWSMKKNLILQGAPGVGKSFVAPRLAYLLLGEKDPARVESVQFHQSYSYEDFVQGYRPDGRGGFTRRDGIFFRFCEKANRAPSRKHVFIIDEINRGNLSKIFGELMLLVEHDKRGPSSSMNLTYSNPDEPRFFVPENVYVLGIMNTADRSLSIVDYALRRRFSFALLEPMFSSDKFKSLLLDRGVPETIVDLVIVRMNILNQAIGEDRANLGRGYRVGHSFFVPPQAFEYDPSWYRRIIETEIYPLLEEYWFDDPEKAEDWQRRLLEDIP